MSKKTTFGDALFALVCVGGIVAVFVANDGATWLAWAQTVMDNAQGMEAPNTLLQAAVGFLTVSVIGSGAMWLRNRNAVEVDPDGAPQIDYRSPDWVDVKVLR